ncbi:MAG: Spy/CpxP family protein refolding chaperone [Hydrogenophaga sp.]|uniref:Spy/CpxP family protein refolding chaperone n=1 Tax=Hydrogenophaga sp. TaxID=1904254 RepID=UPI0040354DB1
MKSLHPRALIAATLATALVGMSATALVQASALQPSAGATTPGTAQLAQTTPAAKPTAPKAEQRDQKRAEHIARMQQKMAERQAAFKTELKLTPEQEPAWNAFVARTQPQARPAREHTREDWSKLTTPQRLDKMQALKAERDAAMAKRTDAIKSFYAALNADQQKVFDAKFMSGYQRAGMRGEHGKHHHQGGHQRMGGPV